MNLCLSRSLAAELSSSEEPWKLQQREGYSTGLTVLVTDNQQVIISTYPAQEIMSPAGGIQWYYYHEQ